MNDQPYPIILFVYNRPEHTQLTLEALQQANMATESRLVIYADAAPVDSSSETRASIKQVGRVIESKKWCKSVEIVYRENNLGLADSIVHGVTETLKSNDAVIVLEDDIIVSKGFLQYMNEALNMYSSVQGVCQVSGFMVPDRNYRNLPKTGFFRAPASWGWGTWARAWKHYNHDASFLFSKVSETEINHFDIDGTYPHFETLKKNISGEIKTWAVRWYASIYLNGGLCLYPNRSLVRNIGFDGSGVHCGEDSSRLYAKIKTASMNRLSPKNTFEETSEFVTAFRDFYQWRFTPSRISFMQRLKSFLLRKVSRN